MGLWSIVAVVALPLFIWLFASLQDRMLVRAWQSTALRLGLEPGGNAQEPVLRGTFRGVPIEIVHSVSYRYKGAARYSFEARAHLSEALALASELDTPGPALDDVFVLDGWLQYSGSGCLEATTLETFLETLLRTCARRQSAPS